MRIPGRKSATLGARWLRSRGVSRGLILGYHRIAEPDWDPYGLAISPQRFAEQLEVLRELTEPVPLAALDDEIPDRAVALTFDDGYADNLAIAAPLLASCEVPATVFVATDYLDGSFWWDELADRLAPDRPLPDPLELRVRDRCYVWSAVGADVDSRRRLVLEVFDHLREVPATDRAEALGRLPALPDAEVRLKVDAARGSANPRALRSDELLRLAERPGIEIGAHTRSHASLGAIATDRQSSEIEGCRRGLEARLGRPVDSFSYPNGSVSSQARSILSRCGFRRACTSRPDAVTSRSDRLRLPRFWLPDWSQDRLRVWLRRWMGAARSDGG